MVAAAALPGSEVTLEDVGLNPTRTGIIDVLRRFGADIDVDAGRADGRRADRHGSSSATAGWGAVEIAPAEVPGVIDELPVLAALATHGGELRVSGAQELRVKESDRISALANGLRRMGADIDEAPDGFHVRGGTRLRGGEVDARQRSPAGHGVRHRGARRLGADHDSRCRRGGRLVSGVLLRARVAAGVRADKLYLVGFMGAGKTTVARVLGRRLGWRVEDIDERIESRERRRSLQSSAQNGEPYFRQARAQILAASCCRSVTLSWRRAAARLRNRITARDACRRRRGVARRAPSPLLDRVPADGRRPLAADRAQMEQLFSRRQLAYAQARP